MTYKVVFYADETWQAVYFEREILADIFATWLSVSKQVTGVTVSVYQLDYDSLRSMLFEEEEQ